MLNRDLEGIFSILKKDDGFTSGRINLVASENLLSPLAKYPYLCDMHGRYYLEDMRRFHQWLFPGGAIVQELEDELLLPLLKAFCRSDYVNVRPISGLNCMTVALAGLTQPGDAIFSLPSQHGGHVSTEVIAKRFGLNQCFIPFEGVHDIDYEALRGELKRALPALVYIDQSTMLFPIDPKPIRDLIDEVSPKTVLHYDSSHTTGLIFGEAMFNPLESGAHIFGGSTHKTLPGPHKGFLATNDLRIHNKVNKMAGHFVSHHHPSSLLSLAVTLLEMKNCGGKQYANQILDNAVTFAKSLSSGGFIVGGESRGYTQSHQVWAYPDSADNLDQHLSDLVRIGVITTRFDDLPGIPRQAFRLSVSEITRLGFKAEAVRTIAKIMTDLVFSRKSHSDLASQVAELRKQHPEVEYCYKTSDLQKLKLPEKLHRYLHSQNAIQSMADLV